MFDQLDFVYLPSNDAAADVEHFTVGLGGRPVFAVERFDTRVAMVQLTAHGPGLLFAEHLESDTPILIFRVADLDAAIVELDQRGVTAGPRFEFPYGFGVEIDNPGPQRLAIYERTRAERGEGLAGRRDF